MKNKLLMVLFSILTVAAVVLTGCSGASPTPTSTTSAPPPANTTASGAASNTGSQPGTSTGSSSTVARAGSGQTGHLEVRVTDAPPSPEVTSIMVTIASVEVHVADTNSVSGNSTAPSANTSKPESQDQDRGKGNKPDKPTATTAAVSSNSSDNDDNGWIALKLSGPTTFDLLALKAMAANGGLTQLLGGVDLPAGTYTQIRLEVQSISVALGNGPAQPATVPSGKIKFIQPFKIVAGQTTGLVFDFDAAASVNVTGNDKVMFKPVIKLSVAKQPATN